jgi:hypothetical protein
MRPHDEKLIFCGYESLNKLLLIPLPACRIHAELCTNSPLTYALRLLTT